VEAQLYVSLTSALESGEWSASSPGRFTPRQRTTGHPLDRRLDKVAKRKIACPSQESNPGHPACSL